MCVMGEYIWVSSVCVISLRLLNMIKCFYKFQFLVVLVNFGRAIQINTKQAPMYKHNKSFVQTLETWCPG